MFCISRALLRHFCCNVVVIGGGHAGCEAISKLKFNSCLITQDKGTIGELSCNVS